MCLLYIKREIAFAAALASFVVIEAKAIGLIEGDDFMPSRGGFEDQAQRQQGLGLST